MGIGPRLGRLRFATTNPLGVTAQSFPPRGDQLHYYYMYSYYSVYKRCLVGFQGDHMKLYSYIYHLVTGSYCSRQAILPPGRRWTGKSSVENKHNYMLSLTRQRTHQRFNGQPGEDLMSKTPPCSPHRNGRLVNPSMGIVSRAPPGFFLAGHQTERRDIRPKQEERKKKLEQKKKKKHRRDKEKKKPRDKALSLSSRGHV